MIESREKVISNIATEERNTHNMTPLIASDMTFFKVFYTFWYLQADDDVKLEICQYDLHKNFFSTNFFRDDDENIKNQKKCVKLDKDFECLT